eukprot:1524562-Pyramimonas_sp.AAC.1
MLKLAHTAGSDNAVRQQVVYTIHADSGMEEEIKRAEIRPLSAPAAAVRGTSERGGRGGPKDAV